MVDVDPEFIEETPPEITALAQRIEELPAKTALKVLARCALRTLNVHLASQSALASGEVLHELRHLIYAVSACFEPEKDRLPLAAFDDQAAMLGAGVTWRNLVAFIQGDQRQTEHEWRRIILISSENVASLPSPEAGETLLSRQASFDLNHASELDKAPLWDPSVRNGTKLSIVDIVGEAWLDTNGQYEFWLEWYSGFYHGAPLDWDLQRRVTLIDDAIWATGPEAVAAEIERIKAEMLSEKLPMAETIELNPETGQFRAVPIPVENAPYMSALLSQISDALEDCLGGHNGLSDRSGDAKKLNRVLTKYRDDPQNAELTLTRVAGSLRAQLHDNRELPDNEDNLALLNAVEEGVRGIRANHPEVASNRAQLAQQAFKALAPEDKQVLEAALPVLTAISEPELADDFAQDIPELTNDARLPLPDGAPPLPGADAATRVFSRLSKMALLQEQYGKLTRKGAEWFDSDTRKTVQLAGLVGGGAIAAGVNFGPKLLELVQIGLRLLGVL